MPYFFGMYIKSKEEKEQEYQNYVKSIFPYGEKQKSAIESLLKRLVPDENQTFLLLYFIQLRERITADPSLSQLIQPCLVRPSVRNLFLTVLKYLPFWKQIYRQTIRYLIRAYRI